MSLEIRRAGEGDVPAIAMLEQCCFHTPWPIEFIYEDVVISRNYYLILEEDGAPIGYAGMWLILDEAHLNNICIHPEHRGGGKGKMLLRALMQAAVDEGVDCMTLEVRVGNPVAIELYKDMGFRIEGIRRKYYQDNGEDAYIMWNKGLALALEE